MSIDPPCPFFPRRSNDSFLVPNRRRGMRQRRSWTTKRMALRLWTKLHSYLCLEIRKHLCWPTPSGFSRRPICRQRVSKSWARAYLYCFLGFAQAPIIQFLVLPNRLIHNAIMLLFVNCLDYFKPTMKANLWLRWCRNVKCPACVNSLLLKSQLQSDGRI